MKRPEQRQLWWAAINKHGLALPLSFAPEKDLSVSKLREFFVSEGFLLYLPIGEIRYQKIAAAKKKVYPYVTRKMKEFRFTQVEVIVDAMTNPKEL